MCGIICYIGKEQVLPILIHGLEMLEYRGYDSAGVSILDEKNITTIKNKGRISDLSSREELNLIKGNIGIAHTRWATHGAPNDENAHPHCDCSNKISIIHNGIIENYQTLKKILIQEEHIFKSNTDSEVIAHLVEKFYENDLKDAVIKTLSLITGTFGLAVIHENCDEIIVARKGSPMVIGLSDKGMFAASDATALLNHTRKVIYLQDGELAILKKNSCEIEDFNGNAKSSNIEEIKWSLEQVEKQGYEHFMLKEIMEQPLSIENGLLGRINPQNKKDKIKLTINIDVKSIEKITIVACGTSYHSGLIGKYFIESLCNLPVEVDYASEFRYRNPIIKKNDLIIAISQSGETADTLAAINLAKNKGAKTIGLVNVVGSTIAREVDGGIYLHAGPEIGVASTKAFTSQLVSLLLLALFIKQERNEELNNELLKDILTLPKIIQKTLEINEDIKKLAKNFMDSKNFLFLGRDINFPVALEGALKLKEISYIHAEGYAAAEMKHGPIALIDSQMPVVFVATKCSLSEKMLSNIQEVKARGGRIITITNKGEMELEKISNHIINVPYVRKELSPIINVIPLQILAYHIANLKGLDVDKPRNLAKSVTVE